MNAQTHAQSTSDYTDQRAVARHNVEVPGWIVWKDARGTARCASVRTRDISQYGVFVDCLEGSAIPLHRLVNFHVDHSARHASELPPSLRGRQVLAAVYRVGPYKKDTGNPASYALRLLVPPDRRRASARPGRPAGAAVVGAGGQQIAA